MKTNKSSNSITTTINNRYYTRITKGVYRTGLKSYRATKRVNGTVFNDTFTTIAAAKRFYSSLPK